MTLLRLKKWSFIKKQLLLFTLFLFVLILLLLIGLILSKYTDDTYYLAFLPEKNNVFLVMWRMGLYSVVLSLLTPRVFTWINKFKNSEREVNSERLLKFQKVTVISIVIYELVIVQNVFRDLIQWGYQYVS
jgi:hypothetical protein